MAAETVHPIPVGKSQITCLADTRTPITVFTYRPTSFNRDQSPLLVVHHGIQRNAEDYLNYSVPIADATGSLLIVPLLDKESFPDSRLKTAGVLNDEGEEPQRRWLSTIITNVITEVKGRERWTDRPHYVLAHSAGAQLASRILYFGSTGQVATLAADAGTWLFPQTTMPFPYGTGGSLPSDLATDEKLRQYLAYPMVVAYGNQDLGTGPPLDTSDPANAQGPNRVERAKNFFAAGKQAASDRGWEFGWSLLEVPDVGHDAGQLFANLPLQQAVFAGKFDSFAAVRKTTP